MMGSIGSPETSVLNHVKRSNNPEEGIIQITATVRVSYIGIDPLEIVFLLLLLLLLLQLIAVVGFLWSAGHLPLSTLH